VQARIEQFAERNRKKQTNYLNQMSRDRANSELRLVMKLEEQSRKQDNNLRKAVSTKNHLEKMNLEKAN
jgi:hypothetical protein